MPAYQTRPYAAQTVAQVLGSVHSERRVTSSEDHVIQVLSVTRRKLPTPGNAEEHKRQETPTINPIGPTDKPHRPSTKHYQVLSVASLIKKMYLLYIWCLELVLAMGRGDCVLLLCMYMWVVRADSVQDSCCVHVRFQTAVSPLSSSVHLRVWHVIEANMTIASTNGVWS